MLHMPELRYRRYKKTIETFTTINPFLIQTVIRTSPIPQKKSRHLMFVVHKNV